MGFVTGPGNTLGRCRSTLSDAREHIFGLVLVNDWSARDIQAWEYQPLGPFLGKSFATTISPWIVTLDALEPFRVEGPVQEPPPLRLSARRRTVGLRDISLAVDLPDEHECESDGLPPETISQTNFRDMYWNVAQQLAHATVNGAIARPGDLFASGTISGCGAGHARKPHRADLERRTPASRCPTARSARSSRTATRSCCAAGAKSLARAASASAPRAAASTAR